VRSTEGAFWHWPRGNSLRSLSTWQVLVQIVRAVAECPELDRCHLCVQKDGDALEKHGHARFEFFATHFGNGSVLTTLGHMTTYRYHPELPQRISARRFRVWAVCNLRLLPIRCSAILMH
jgi:hypothetical protein